MADVTALDGISRKTVRRRRNLEPPRSFALLAVFAFAGFSPGIAWAQLVGPPIPGYVHNIWTTQHGLPQNQILDIVETRDGYLWVATGHGVARFDGLKFAVFDISTHGELPANWISALHEDRDGVLWLGTDRGLVTYRDGSFRAQQIAPDLNGGYVHGIQQDSAGRLWIAIDGRVMRRDGDHWNAIPLGDAYAMGLLVDHEDVLWIGTATGLIEWRDRIVRTITTRDGLPKGHGRIEPHYADRAGRVWVHASPGLVIVDRETGKAKPAPGALARSFVGDIIEGTDDQLWVAGGGALFTYARDGSVTAYPLEDSGEHIQAMARDRKGHLWFGVSGGRGGLRRLAPRRVTSLAREQGLPCENAAAMTEAPDGALWATLLCPGADVGRLVSIRNGRITPYREPNGTPLPVVTSLLTVPDGSLWVGTYEGQLLHMGNGRSTRYTTTNSGLVGREIVALHRDEEGALWIGTNEGLNRFLDGRWTTFRANDGLVDNDVRFVTGDRTGAVWIGTRGGVSRYVNGRFTNLTAADGLARGAVRAIHIDDEQTVWIGTYGGGLCRLKDDGRLTCFGRHGGLLDSSVHRILEDSHGYLWMSGDQGIRRVSRDELNAVADGRSGRLVVDMYDERDGMKNEETNGMAQPAGWKTRDGSLWFPTQGGIVRIDQSTIDSAVSAPPVVIGQVLVNGTAYDSAHEIIVPPGSTDLEIYYTAPEFSRPEQIQFRYRLDGHDADWIYAGTRRVAHYTNLTPGSYRFEVSARGSAGVWHAEGANVGLVLQPYFYQRPVFHGVAILLGALIAYGVYNLRVLQLRRRTRALGAVVASRTIELLKEREGLNIVNQQLNETNAQLSDAKAVADASRTHLLSVLDELRVGVMVVDDGERVVFASRATCLLIAGTDEGIVGRSLGDVLPVSADIMTELRAHVRAPRPGTRLTAKLEPLVGPEHYWTEIETRVDPLNEHHRILCFYDITEVFELKRATDFSGAGSSGLIGSSGAMRLVYAQIRTLAGVDTTVLIEGETGTGKELVARSIHEASARRDRRFVAINCAGLTESLLASQLFGHKRGAFTGALSDHVGLFETAQGGTLLLDEIGDMPMNMQTHLLRVLQEREIVRVGDSIPRPIDVRVLASTHRSLEQEVAAGQFREDLLYRIRVARVQLPPLRQRTEDIPQLATGFVSQFSAAHGKPLKGISRDAMERLVAHRWPGNVRELRSVIEWAVIHGSGHIVRQTDFPPELSPEAVPPPRATMPEAERRLLIETLKRTGGNRSVAARLLGVSRATLYRRLAALDEAAPEETPRSA